MLQNLIPNAHTRAILAAFFFIAGVVPSKALQFGDFTYEATATDVTITGYTGTGALVTIPPSIVGLPVTNIEGYAFANKTTLISVAIPRSVTSIVSSAFVDCSRLTSVTVDPANPNYSDVAGVFFNKNQSTLIQYPQGKTGSYTIPNSVTSIGDSAFSGCYGLTSVTIPNSVTSIGYSAFGDCKALTSITIPNSVTYIDYSAFSNCDGLTDVKIPKLFLGDIEYIGLNGQGGASALLYCLSRGPEGELSSKADLSEAIAPLASKASKADLSEAIAPLASKASKADLSEAIAPLASKASKADLSEAIAPLASKASKADLSEAIAPLANRLDDIGASSDSVITSNLANLILARGKAMSYSTTTNFGANAFSAVGLPGGLSINPVTGVIAGKASKKGTYSAFIYAGIPAGPVAISVKVFIVN